ncbi:MAG: geranylgeranylglycerol-phosphate geranylgeranyltransferase [Euryarchaeota archaeon]|nr:geranylgeranylglycerol-phosphate geranylgeranyltransferase [Euryarchaeota archaeon]
MDIAGYFRIIRPVNSFVAGFAVLLGYVIASGTITRESLVLIPVVLLITAAGNVINDYYDRGIDKINKPERPIPAGAVSPEGALAYSILLFLSSIGISYFANTLCFAIAVFNSLLLVLYAYRLKNMPLVGNIAVSYLAASIFLFGGALVGVEGLFQTLVVAGITFLAMLARELLKDAEDVVGDTKGGAKTLPILIGVRKTAVMAFVLAISATILSYMPLVRWWGIPYIVAISIADLIILSGAARGLGCTSPDCVILSGATKIIKAGMFVALFVFISFAILL